MRFCVKWKSLLTDKVREFTVEAGRPDSITQEKLEVLRKHGITRISINPQTMNQKTLDLIGRRHTVEDVREKFHLARGLGFDNINMDLIVGLPEETLLRCKEYDGRDKGAGTGQRNRSFPGNQESREAEYV